MGDALNDRLRALREDYARTVGEPFEHFYCPLLFRDEDVELCAGHVVSQAFSGASRAWTVQRKDIDNFYGSLFESEFELLQEAPRLSAATILSDSKLSRAVSLKFFLDGEEVGYYTPQGSVPPHFTPVTLHDKGEVVPVAFKMAKEEMIASAERSWQVDYRKDVRLAAFVSLIKAAHLTLFELLGYQYVITASGYFLGHDVLGRFFLENREKPRRDALASAEAFFREFQHMARPVVGWKELDGFRGSITDRSFIACEGSSGRVWGLIVVVNTGQSIYGVMVPGEAQSAPVFMEFLRNETETISGLLCRFEDDQWTASTAIKMKWPKTGVLLP